MVNPVIGRRYVDNSQVCSDVGPLVWRAAVLQGIQLRRLRALWPMAGTWLIEGRVMNTVSAVIDGSIASPKFGKMRITSSSMTVEAWIPSEIEAISPLWIG